MFSRAVRHCSSFTSCALSSWGFAVEWKKPFLTTHSFGAVLYFRVGGECPARLVFGLQSSRVVLLRVSGNANKKTKSLLSLVSFICMPQHPKLLRLQERTTTSSSIHTLKKIQNDFCLFKTQCLLSFKIMYPDILNLSLLTSSSPLNWEKNNTLEIEFLCPWFQLFWWRIS